MRKYEMLVECVKSYRFIQHDDGSAEVHIEIPKRFAALWATKMNDLYTDDKEIGEFKR